MIIKHLLKNLFLKYWRENKSSSSKINGLQIITGNSKKTPFLLQIKVGHPHTEFVDGGPANANAGHVLLIQSAVSGSVRDSFGMVYGVLIYKCMYRSIDPSIDPWSPAKSNTGVAAEYISLFFVLACLSNTYSLPSICLIYMYVSDNASQWYVANTGVVHCLAIGMAPPRLNRSP